MIRKSSISTLIALLIVSTMTLADSRTWVFEHDEIIESTEIENEELKESSEVEPEWHRLHLSGGPDFLHASTLYLKSAVLHLVADLGNYDQPLCYSLRLPLFILHCSLKIHLG